MLKLLSLIWDYTKITSEICPWYAGEEQTYNGEKNIVWESCWSRWLRGRVSGAAEALRGTCRTSCYLAVPGRVQPSAEPGSISSALCQLFS